MSKAKKLTFESGVKSIVDTIYEYILLDYKIEKTKPHRTRRKEKSFKVHITADSLKKELQLCRIRKSIFHRVLYVIVRKLKRFIISYDIDEKSKNIILTLSYIPTDKSFEFTLQELRFVNGKGDIPKCEPFDIL